MTGKDENPANYNAITDYLTENFKDMDIALQVSTNFVYTISAIFIFIFT